MDNNSLSCPHCGREIKAKDFSDTEYFESEPLTDPKPLTLKQLENCYFAWIKELSNDLKDSSFCAVLFNDSNVKLLDTKKFDESVATSVSEKRVSDYGVTWIAYDREVKVE